MDIFGNIKIYAPASGIISTFDKEISEIGRIPDENVKSELDRDIFKLQKLNYHFKLWNRK